jgi:hypothetical protein
MPLNYKEKGFASRNNKKEFNEWFSTRTPTFMPYVFLGLSVRQGISFKLQYYLNNFLNADYKSTSNGITSAPYAGYDVHLLLFSIGHTFRYRYHHHSKAISTEETKVASM